MTRRDLAVFSTGFAVGFWFFLALAIAGRLR